ncbi:MAG: ABC transporter permease [Chitinophagaceae bacterium]
MLKSYFKIAWRSLVKNKLSSIINIGGLIVGLSTSILILLFVVNELGYDRFHSNINNLYLLIKNEQHADGISTGKSTAGPMADVMRRQFPEVAYSGRVAGFGGELTRVGDKVLYGSGIYTDPDLFKMMSFPAVQGDPFRTLQDASSIVISESAAKKMFGNQDALGQTILFKNKTVFKIGAIVKDLPPNSTIQFEMVIPFQYFELDNPWLAKWDDNRINTWIQLKDAANINSVNTRLTKLIQEKTNDKTVSLFVYPMKRAHLYNNFSNGKPDGGNIYIVELFAALGIFTLLIACINFMNLATARSEERAREVGVRKVLGASKRRISAQFFAEALLMTFIALVFSVLLAVIVLPAFNQLIRKRLVLDYSSFGLWVLLISIGFITALVAGSYPAIRFSRVNTVSVLKGVLSTKEKRGRLRMALVTFQFVISIFLIISTIVIFKEIDYVQNRPIGYDQENLIDIDANGELGSHYELFKQELASIPAVRSITAGSDNMTGFGSGVSGLDYPGRIPGHELSLMVTNVQYDWIKTTGLQLSEGREFSPSFGTDTAACLINETAVQKMGLKSPVVGIKIGGNRVIGVFKNFVFNNPSGIIAPMIVYLQKNNLSHIYIRIENNNGWKQTMAQVEKITKKINPAYPFKYSFVNEQYQERFKEFSSIGMLSAIFGGMAIFISCLGLFALSAYVAEKRSKEMSIRKVLGASVGEICILLSGNFLIPVFIALAIVIPVAVWSMSTLLSNITYHFQLNAWVFILSALISLIIALLTVSYHGIRAGIEKPIRRLRND